MFPQLLLFILEVWNVFSAAMPPKRSKAPPSSSSSETDEVPVDPKPSGSGLQKARKLHEAPTRNQILWTYFEKDPNFVKTKAGQWAKVLHSFCFFIA